MELYHALQLSAMAAALKPDREAWFRGICRWYSKEFSTSLLDVYDLPTEHVLQEYYESRFEEMEDEEREEHIARLLETDEQRDARELTEVQAERAGDEMYDQLNRQVQEDVDKGRLAPRYEPRSAKNVKLKLADAKSRLGRLGAQQTPSATAALAEETVAEMNFDTGGNLLDRDVLSPPPSRFKKKS